MIAAVEWWSLGETLIWPALILFVIVVVPIVMLAQWAWTLLEPRIPGRWADWWMDAPDWIGAVLRFLGGAVMVVLMAACAYVIIRAG